MHVTQEEYIKVRLDDQIDWYDRKSARNQHMYKSLQLVIVIASSSIPFLSAYSSNSYFIPLVVGVLGVVVAVITAINGFYKFQENWIAYRSTSESLKHEKFLFMTGTEPYQGQNAFNLLVQNVETLISQENSTWGKHMEHSQQDKSPPPLVEA
jgi:hypothetical protein